MLTIIIPTLNEEENIAALLTYLKLNNSKTKLEIIISDAGSSDGTMQRAISAGAKAVVSPKKGRAAQMNFGASLACGSVLYFIHADVLPPASFVNDIEQAIKRGYSLGRYRTRFNSNRNILKLNAFFTRFDLLMCYGGDQTLFIQKELFTSIGGFNDGMIIMEDYEIIERAKRKGKYKVMKKAALISARKYDTNTWWQVQRANYMAVKMYKKGISQLTIADTYKKNLKQQFITGVQQVGIGVKDAVAAKYLYKDLLGMNVLVFDDIAKANLMAQYTGNKIYERRAILSLNMQGGGGVEIWQFTKRQATCAPASELIGDIGIFGVKIKTVNIDKAYATFAKNRLVTASPLVVSPDGRKHFWIKDPYGNSFNIVENAHCFRKTNNVCGGVTGAIIGVTNMEKAMDFYIHVLGINKIMYDVTEPINDGPDVNETGMHYRRVLLAKDAARHGAFSRLLGDVEIELIEAKGKVANKIFHNRYWGDCGFIHLCFDVTDMNAFKEHTATHKRSFSVDSADSFFMGSSAGRFCYIEDPDGTLIELVETHKVPAFKKLGLYLNLKKRKTKKPLPDWMVGLLALNKIK